MSIGVDERRCSSVVSGDARLTEVFGLRNDKNVMHRSVLGKRRVHLDESKAYFRLGNASVNILFRENADRRHFRVVVVDENAVFTQAFQLEFAAVDQDDFEVNARDDSGGT